MRRESFRKKASILGLALIVATTPLLGQRSDKPKKEKAIPEITTIEADLEALPAKDVRDEIDIKKLDVPEEFRKQLRGSIKASQGIGIKKVMHWTEDATPFAVEFEGKGIVALELPKKLGKTDSTDGEKKEIKTSKDVFFVTANVQPALSTDPNELSLVFIGGATIGFGLEPPTRGIRAGKVFFLNGDAREADLEDWVMLNISFPVNEDYQFDMPVELTVRVDPKAGEWDLFLMNTLRYAGIKYGKPFKGLSMRSEGTGPTRLTELAFHQQNPLFEDADSDGIEDAVEVELGFSSQENDRYALDELGEFTNLQHFMNLYKVYKSRAEREVEQTIAQAIALKEKGEEPTEELKALQIPNELRKIEFTEESFKAQAKQKAEKLKGFGRKEEDRTEDAVIVPGNGKEGE